MTALYGFDYDWAADLWSLSYVPEGILGYEENVHQFPVPPPSGSFSLYGTVTSVGSNSAIGLAIQFDSGSDQSVVEYLVRWYPGPESDESVVFVDALGTTDLRIDFDGENLTLNYSEDGGGTWTESAVVPALSVTETGITLLYTDPAQQAWGFISRVVTTDGPVDSDVVADVQIQALGTPAPPVAPAVTATGEPTVYALLGAPFGDQEFDIGKSARWLQYFSNKLFALDVNLGDQRYWIINWAKTFPDAEHAVTNINYFEQPVKFRKEQFRLAQQFFEMNDDDWVIWIDGTEGLSFDNASLPTDYASAPFLSFMWREVQRAITAGRDYSVLPLFVFLRSASIQNISYDQNRVSPDVDSVLQPSSVPYYLVSSGMKRLVKVSALRNAAFPWAEIDTLTTPSTGVKAQIVSYAYAHWNLLNVPPGETEPPPRTIDNDEGWKMRKQISRVRPIAGLDFTNYAAADPAGVPGPWAVYTTINTHPDLVVFSDSPVTTPDATALGVKTPLYDTVVRLNLRDGVWYEGGESGNTPMVWDSINQVWQTPYDPAKWPTKGVKAPENPDFVEPPVPGVDPM